MLAPTQPQPNNMTPAQPEVNPVMPDGAPQHNGYSPEADKSLQGAGEDSAGPTEEEVAAHLDSLPDEAKAFLAEHLTPEFVTAIGLISGEVVAQHLMKYADQDKVLVPVPRKVAEEHLAQMKGQPQGQPQMQAPVQAAPQATPAPAPQGGMMAPMQPPATPQ